MKQSLLIITFIFLLLVEIYSICTFAIAILAIQKALPVSLYAIGFLIGKLFFIIVLFFTIRYCLHKIREN